MKAFHFEKLKGDLKDQYSIRLNKQFRHILQFEPSEEGKVAVIVGLEDDH